MEERVTTIGCRRSTAMKKPLKAPVTTPMPTPARVQTSIEPGSSCILPASTTLTRETTAPAERSKPPESTTRVSPIAAIARVAPPLERKLNSK